KDDKDDDADNEGDDHVIDTQDADDEDDETESDEDEIYKCKIRVCKDEDVEMKDAEVEESDKGEENVTDAAKEEAEKTSEAKDDAKKTELPPSSSSLSLSSGFAKQESEKSPSDILKIKKEQVEKQKKPQFTIKSTYKAALKDFDLKSALYQSMHTNKSFNRNPANHKLYHALTEALIEDENAMDKRVADTVKDHKRKHDDNKDDDDEDPSARPNQGKKTKRRRTKESESSKKPSTTKETPKGKALTKGSKTGKSASVKEPVEEPIAEVIMDDAGDDVVHDDDQPQASSEPKTSKTLNPEWFKQPSGPLTPDPELKKRQLYKFKECDFVDLHLNDIEDMLLLDVQHKLFHLDGNVIVDFIVALRMFKRSIILKRRVEDLQLGVESYQKNLNITKPQKTFSEIKFKEPYTSSYNPPGIIYKDLDKQKRVLRADELYKFSDGTLKSVCDEIHHRVLDFHLDYNK
nr:hypothetical protein [Tanacetum cinerariifolium]